MKRAKTGRGQGARSRPDKLKRRPSTKAVAELERSVERAQRLAEEARAPNTLRAYRADLKTFAAWCDEHGLVALPSSPDVVATYVAHLDELGRKPSTIDRALVAISQAHKLAGLPSPTSDAKVREVLKGLKRRRKVAPTKKKAILVEDLIVLVSHLDLDTMAGLRDRAVLLIGFGGAFRRSELAALVIDDLTFSSDGLVVRVRSSKTDQIGTGDDKALPFAQREQLCPVRCLRTWLDEAAIEAGPVFRPVNKGGQVGEAPVSGHAIGAIVKRAAERAGLEPQAFAGHSLRSGFATSAARAGKSIRAIKKQTGHRSDRVLEGYIHAGQLFDDNALSGLL